MSTTGALSPKQKKKISHDIFFFKVCFMRFVLAIGKKWFFCAAEVLVFSSIGGLIKAPSGGLENDD